MPTELATYVQNAGDVPANASPRRRLTLLYALLILAALPATFDYGAIEVAVALRPDPDAANTYLQFHHFLSVYLRAPLVIISAFVLLLSPGLFIALLLGVSRTFSQWILYGFFITLMTLAAVVTLTQAITDWSPRGVGFALLVIACTSIAFLITLFACERGRGLWFPRVKAESSFDLLLIVLFPALLLATLGPKFYWESFNGDGAHAYEASRLLLHQPLPFWDRAAGEVADFPSFKSLLFTYPSSWFIRLCGEYEASARIPFALYLSVLYAATITIVVHGRRLRLGRSASLLICLSLLSYALVMSFSATYNPYCSDIALPATQDTLLMICALGLIHAFTSGRPGWIIVTTFLTFFTSAAALPVVALFMVSVVLVYRPTPWKALFVLASSVIGFVIVTVLLPSLFQRIGLPVPGREHSTFSLLGKFRYILPFDYKRFAYLLVPCGIYPLVGLLFWRRCDQLTKTLILLTGCVFGLYYFMAFISLHYFVPVMILPIVCFWRHQRPSQWTRPITALTACFIAAASSIAFGIPPTTTIYTGSRTIGHQIDMSRFVGYSEMAPEVYKASEMLKHLFPYDLHPTVPELSYGGSPLAWNYYAHDAASHRAAKNYVVCPVDTKAPPDSSLVHSDESGSVHVRHKPMWVMHRAMRPPGSHGGPIYTINRDILFGRPDAFNQYWALDLLPTVQWLGFNVPPSSQHEDAVYEQ